MADAHKYQAHEVLNRVLNSGEDALNVDIDNVTLTTEGGDVAIDVALDKANDSVTIYANTAADGSGTNTVPLVDAAGNLQIDIVSSALPSGGATAANQSTIIGHVDGLETLITSTNSKIDTLDAVQDNALTKLGEIETTNNANQVLLGTIDSDTDAIKTAVQILDNAISGSEMQVDVVASLPAGSAAIGKLAANSGVDIGDVDVTSVVPGTGATNLGKAEDAAHSSGDTGVMSLAVRNDDVAALGGADGDYAPLQVNAAGSLYTTDATGEAGSILVTGTNAVTTGISNTKFIAIQFIEDSVFASSGGLVAASEQLYPDDTGVGSDISSNGAAIDGVTFPQGMTIFGRWNGFTLASGKVIGYIGYV
jgi:hypothetical protein